MYHGTRSSFAESIESKGWKLNDVPYDRSDAKLVCDIFYSVGYTDRADFLFGVFKLDATIRASFTHNYWLARNYAANERGESLNFLIEEIDDFSNFVSNKQSLLKLREELEVLREGPDEETKRLLKKLGHNRWKLFSIPSSSTILFIL